MTSGREIRKNVRAELRERRKQREGRLLEFATAGAAVVTAEANAGEKAEAALEEVSERELLELTGFRESDVRRWRQRARQAGEQQAADNAAADSSDAGAPPLHGTLTEDGDGDETGPASAPDVASPERAD